MFGNLLEGKKGLIMGVANNKSIAWGIAEICNKAGAKLAFTYQSDALLKRLEPLANSIGSNILIECDVSDPNSVTKTFKKLKEKHKTFLKNIMENLYGMTLQILLIKIINFS